MSFQRILLQLIPAMLALGLLSATIASAGTSGSLSFSYGQKYLSDDWGDASTQDEITFALAIGGDTWPLSIVLERLISVDAGLIDVETTDELSLGVRRTWTMGKNGAFRPFVSGGFAHISGAVGVGGGSNVVVEDDSAVGFYLDGGLGYELTRHMHLLGTLRYSRAEADDVPLGGTHLSGGIGYHW